MSYINLCIGILVIKGGARVTVYLVTGGSGFIGSHIIEALLNKGEKVKAIDNFSTGNKENLKAIINDIELIEGDITDDQVLKQAIKGVDIIFHQAAVPSVPKSIKDPIKSNHVNVSGTLQLLHTAMENGVSRFIYAASSSAYGNSTILPKQEDMIATPLSPYAVSKYTGELYCKVFYEIYGLETISLRYFNVFGPKQDADAEYAAVIPKFIQSILVNQLPTIYGDGTQSRDFTYIENVVSANLLAAQASQLSGEVINVGSGKSIDLNNLVTRISRIVGKQIKPVYAEKRQGDVEHSLADIQRAYKLIGYKPIISFEEGLRKTIKWFDGKVL